MKRLALCLTLLMIVSVSSAYIYDFNSLTSGQVLNGQSDDATCIWRAIANPSQGYDVTDAGGGDLQAHSFASKQEQLVATLSYVGGQKPFYMSGYTSAELSYTGLMNVQQGALVGIWIDGGLDPNFDAANNTMASNNFELLCQFGVASGKWRIRGANGQYSVNTTATGLAPATALYEMKVTLKLDLAAYAGDGSMSLSYEDLTNAPGTIVKPAGYQDIHLNLLADADYANPANWTSWWIRSQASAYDANVGGMTIDDLTMLPEPATLSLLVLGGLACMRRRR